MLKKIGAENEQSDEIPPLITGETDAALPYKSPASSSTMIPASVPSK